MAHGLVDRRTQDVDLFTNEEGGVEAAAQVVEAALQAAGLDAERHDKTGGIADLFPGMGEGLAEWSVRAPDGRATVLQLAYFSRCRAPVLMDVGPVLDIEDVVGGKVSALASRAEPRDYVDTAAALGRYTVDQLIGFSRRLDSGLEQRDFADAGLQLDKWSDDVFASYGLTPAEVAEIRRRFAAWPRSYR
jgi:Nucleotidyl transferase AbiEii toxin, Type IV TA system